MARNDYLLGGYDLGQNGGGQQGGPMASAIRGGFADVPGVSAISGMGAPSVVRGAFVGGTSAAILTTATGTITISPQGTAFRPEDLMFPDAIAPDVTVTSIKIQTREFVLSSAGLPGACLAASAVRAQLNLDVIQAGQSMIVTVTNNALVTRTVTMMATGTSLQ